MYSSIIVSDRMMIRIRSAAGQGRPLGVALPLSRMPDWALLAACRAACNISCGIPETMDASCYV